MPRLPTLPVQDVTGHQTWSLLKGYLAAALADKGYLRFSPHLRPPPIELGSASTRDCHWTVTKVTESKNLVVNGLVAGSPDVVIPKDGKALVIPRLVL